MQREIKITADGFPTLFASELNEHYHSTNGAYTESMHVFIQAGLYVKLRDRTAQLNILEIGLGTGLNLLLTKQCASPFKLDFSYLALEPYPLSVSVINDLKQFDFGSFDLSKADFELIHTAKFGADIKLDDHFVFTKLQRRIEDFTFTKQADLVYFDAFGPQVQPEIWSEENFNKIYNGMHSDGILVTYCAKGAVRRTLQAVGFSVERIPGPPGKREMLRATKK